MKKQSNTLLIRDLDTTTMEILEKVKDYTNEKTQTKAVLDLLKEFESLIKIKSAYYNLVETHHNLIGTISDYLSAEMEIKEAIKNVPTKVRSTQPDRY